jgi:hypothetical protein
MDFVKSGLALVAGTLDCRRPNYTVDADSSACFVSKVQHLVVPRDTTAIGFAYCQVNRD